MGNTHSDDFANGCAHIRVPRDGLLFWVGLEHQEGESKWFHGVVVGKCLYN